VTPEDSETPGPSLHRGFVVLLLLAVLVVVLPERPASARPAGRRPVLALGPAGTHGLASTAAIALSIGRAASRSVVVAVGQQCVLHQPSSQ
jgi:hypothetical protein